MFQARLILNSLLKRPWIARLCLLGPLAFASIAFFVTATNAETWTDATGKFSLEAEFVGVQGKSIVLLKSNGDKVNVPIARLSTESRNQAREAYEQIRSVLNQPVDPASESATSKAPTTTRTLNFAPPTVPATTAMKPFPDSLSVRETIDFIKQQILAGHPEVIWHALPAEMRETLDDERFRSEVSPFMDQQTPLQSQVEPVVFKAIEVLVTKKNFVLGSPLLQQAPPDAIPQIQQAYDPAVGVLYEVVELAFSFDASGDRTLSQTINYHGPRIGAHLKQLLPLLGADAIDDFLNSLTIEQIDEDHAIVRVPDSVAAEPRGDFEFKFTSREAKLVRVSNRWVTQEWLEQCKDIQEKLDAGELKQSLELMNEANAENMQGMTMMVGMFTAMANTTLDSMLAAQTQEQFDQSIAQVSAMANIGGGMEMESAEIEFSFDAEDSIPFDADPSMNGSDSESAADSPKPAGPAPEGWTLDIANVETPETPAAGVADGQPTKITEATMSDGILHLTHSEGQNQVSSWVIFTFLDEGESADGKLFDINTESGYASPHIHFNYRTAAGNRETEMFISDYAMRLEFGQSTDGKLPGKIYLCLPDANKSMLRGTFTATMEP